MENKQERKFLAKCSGDCKQKTVHSIFGISRKRGIRLKCDKCGSKLKRYKNIKNLQTTNPLLKNNPSHKELGVSIKNKHPSQSNDITKLEKKQNGKN